MRRQTTGTDDCLQGVRSGKSDLRSKEGFELGEALRDHRCIF